MKRMVAVILAMVMSLTVVAGACAASREEAAESIIDFCRSMLSQIKELYDRDGTLSDGDTELAYSYYHMYGAAKRVRSIERLYPSPAVYAFKMDPGIELENLIDGEWLKFLKGEVTKEKFLDVLMTMVDSVLKEAD